MADQRGYQSWVSQLPRKPGPTADTDYIQSPADGLWYTVPKLPGDAAPPAEPVAAAPAEQPSAVGQHLQGVWDKTKNFIPELIQALPSAGELLHENVAASMERAKQNLIATPDDGSMSSSIRRRVGEALRFGMPNLLAPVDAGMGKMLQPLAEGMADRTKLIPETAAEQAKNARPDLIDSAGAAVTAKDWRGAPLDSALQLAGEAADSVVDMGKAAYEHPGAMAGSLIGQTVMNPQYLAVGDLGGAAAGARVARAAGAGEKGAKMAAALGRIGGEATSLAGLMAGTEALRQAGDRPAMDWEEVARQGGGGAVLGGAFGAIHSLNAPAPLETLRRPQPGDFPEGPEVPGTPEVTGPEGGDALPNPNAPPPAPEPPGSPTGGAGEGKPVVRPKKLSELRDYAIQAGVDPAMVDQITGARLRRKITQPEAFKQLNDLIDAVEKPAQEAAQTGGEKAETGTNSPSVPPADAAPTLQPDETGHVETTVAGQQVRVNVNPTEGQKATGNYAKGHVTVQGLPVTIENPKGTTRSGENFDGKPWTSTLAHDYGYVKGTVGADGDHVDAYVGPNPEAEQVYVIDQHGSAAQGQMGFDEHKAMLGFDSAEDALKGYRANFPEGWDGAQHVTTMTVPEFKDWLKKPGASRRPLAGSEHAPIGQKVRYSIDNGKLSARLEPTTGAETATAAPPTEAPAAPPVEQPKPTLRETIEAKKAAVETPPAAAETPKPTLREQAEQRKADSQPVEGTLTERTLPHPRYPTPLAEIHTFQTKNGKWGAQPSYGTMLRSESGPKYPGTYATEAEALEAGKARIRKGLDKPYETTTQNDERDRQKILKWVDQQKPNEAHAPAPPQQQEQDDETVTELPELEPEWTGKPASDEDAAALEEHGIDLSGKDWPTIEKMHGDGYRIFGFHEQDEDGAMELPNIGDVRRFTNDALVALPPAAEPEPAPASDPEAKFIDTIGERTLGAFGQKAVRDIVEARKLYEEITGTKPTGVTQKRVDELVERAIVQQARSVVEQGMSPGDTFDTLVHMYGRQPNLGTRTSTSIEQQAYSTPAPLAYVAAKLAGIGKDTTVLEPTAGNGMLLITASPKNAVVNELNPDRAASLEAQGFRVTQKDAAEGNLRHSGYPVDAVIANPPFGVVRTAAGEAKTFTIDGLFRTGEIDHAISFRALQHMADDGRAVLIIGGVNKQASSTEARSDAYNGAAKRRFFWNLYNNYNVTDHFTVAGELYAKQGAAWPVDVIVIHGRGKSARALPAVDVPRVYSSWADLKPVLEGANEPDRLVPGAGAQRPAADERAGEAGREPELRGVPAPAERAPAGPGERDAESAGNGQQAEPVAGGERPAERPAVEPARGSSAAPDLQQPDRETAPVGGGAGTPAGDAGAAAIGGGGTEGGPGGAGAGEARSVGSRPRAGASNLEAPQQPYQPASRSNAIGTLVPTNMRAPVERALDALEQRNGSLDAFVAKELGYNPAEIGRYFSAEQVDALGLALQQMKSGKGFIIGDQTGIGKGRVVAGVIRWALKNGQTPIFVTEKPNLYADMYRDLTDIGVPEIRPVMTNGGERVPLDDAGNVVLKTGSNHAKELAKMTANADLGEFNMIFTTYSQMQTVKEQATPRMQFLSAFAPNAVVIFDESHNAGGNDAGGRAKKREDGQTKEGRAAFARSLAGMAKAVFYSSATYAKRPNVMDLYFKTDMALAVEGDVRKLPGAIEAGGVPLQQVVASMLTNAGQYIRRERSFAGVEYNTPLVPVDRNAAEQISAIMLAVKQFDDLKWVILKQIKKDLKAEASTVETDGATGKAGVESTNFTSIMHNIIDQMLLALKADAAADRAIAAFKAGEKPVVTVANTMGSFIEEYAADAGLKPGDVMALGFKALLRRYLERSRDYTVKRPDGSVEKKRLEDEEMGPKGVAFFRSIEKMIRDAKALNAVPASPIDWIHYRLAKEGIKSSEITGRTHVIRYAEGKEPVYMNRSGRETSIAGRRKVITDFNSGALDVVVLNQAGATGLSLHASEKFKDKRRRRMILAQPEKNIDTHMQMLGRVHRTGQVIAPAYDQLVADVPAEKRPAAVLAKKMASLNANTTGARGSQFSSKETLDFINVYGDEAVASMMEDNREIHERLGEPLSGNDEGTGLSREEAARKVTGRIPLLPVAEQEAFYEQLAQTYQELLARAEALGENALEAKTLDLDARQVASTELFQGKDSSSPFSEGAFAQTMDVKRLGKPYTSAQVIERLATRLGLPTDSTFGKVQAHAQEQWQRDRLAVRPEWQKYLLEEERKLLDSEVIKEDAREGKMAMLQAIGRQWEDMAEKLVPGRTYELTTPEGVSFYGVLQRIERKKGVKMPVARGSWSAYFDVADGMREISFPFSKMVIGLGGDIPVNGARIQQQAYDQVTRTPILKLFDEGQTASRERRIIVTGNLLAGFSKVKKGQIVNYTDHDGAVQQGILMPKKFDLAEFAEEQAVELPYNTVRRFLNLAAQGIVRSADGAFTIRNAGYDRFLLSTPKSKAEGGKYFLNQNLRTAVGDFVSRGNAMHAYADGGQLSEVMATLRSLGEKLYTDTFKDEARKAGGIGMGQKKPAAADEGEDDGQYMAPAGMPRVDTDNLLPTGEVAQFLSDVRKHFSSLVPIHLHPNGEALGQALGKEVPKDALGFWNRRDQDVHIIVDRVRSLDEARELLRHELVGHMAMERLPAFQKALDSVWQMRKIGGSSMKGLWAEVDKRYPGRSDNYRAREVIALMAERGIQNRVIERLEDAIRREVDQPLTEDELRAVILQAARLLPEEAQRLLGVEPPPPSPLLPAHALAEYPAPEDGSQNAELQFMIRTPTVLSTPAELLNRVGRGMVENEVALSIRRVLNPVNIDESSKETARMARAQFGVLARQTEVARASLEKYARQMDLLSPRDQLQIIDDIEEGRPQANPAFQPMADELRRLLDHWRERIQSLGVGALDSWIEDYFPHMWQRPGQAAKLVGMIMGKRPLKGPASFLKKRTIPTTREGIAVGLKPVSTNPLILAFMKIREMERFYTGVRLMQQLKDAELAIFVRSGAKTPAGMVDIQDAVGRVRQWSETERGFIERGRYVMPENAARIINNHLTGSKLQNFAPYHVFRVASNMLNAVQLGFSAFHLGFTTLDAVISKGALGIERLAAGDAAGAAKAMLEWATGPGAAVANIRRGSKLLEAYTNPGGATPQLLRIARAMELGGGRIAMDAIFNVTAGQSPFKGTSVWSLAQDVKAAMNSPLNRMERLSTALRSFPLQYATRLWRDLQAMAATMPKFQIPFEIVGRVVRGTTSIIMEHIVPLQKLGVFSDMAGDYLRRNPNATDEELAAAMQKAWNSVDNRLGEMVYDNLFWNRTFRDATHIAIRAVGWNYGTISEIAGAGVDMLKLIDKAARNGIGDGGGGGGGGSRSGRAGAGEPGRGGGVTVDDLGHKIPYVMSLVITTAIAGAILTYLYTGHGPEETEDYFFPPTGGETLYGTKQRLSLPAYTKDIVEYAHEPGQTAMNKLNPMFSVIGSLYSNEDFMGRAIYNPGDTLGGKAADVATYLKNEATPFSMQQRQAVSKPGDSPLANALNRIAPYVGLTAAPGRITSREQIERARDLRKGQAYMQTLNSRLQEAIEAHDTVAIQSLTMKKAEEARKLRELGAQVRIDRAQRKAAKGRAAAAAANEAP